jgi:hypothetical protein
MDLDFTEEQDMLRNLVRGVCNDVAPLTVVRDGGGRPAGLPGRCGASSPTST